MNSRQGYSLLAVSWISWAWVWSLRIMFPTIMPVIGKDLSFTQGQEFTLVGVFNLSTGIAFFIFGYLGDRFGRKKIILVGFLASAALMLVFSQLSSYLLMIILGAGGGFSLGAYPTNATAVLSDYYPSSRRGLIIGVHETGAAIGQFIGPIIVGAGILFLMWRDVLGIWALFGILPLILYFVFAPVRTPLEKGRQEVRSKSKLAKSQVLLIVLAYAGIQAALSGFLGTLPVYLVDKLGVEVTLVAFVLGFSRLPSPVAQLLLGRAADKLGRKPILIIITAAVAICTAVLAYSPFNWLFIVVLFVQFLFGAAFFPVMLAGISDLTSLDDRGSMMGIGMSVGTLVGSGGVPIEVGLVSTSAGYQIAFIFPVLLVAVGALATVGLRFRANESKSLASSAIT